MASLKVPTSHEFNVNQFPPYNREGDTNLSEKDREMFYKPGQDGSPNSVTHKNIVSNAKQPKNNREEKSSESLKRIRSKNSIATVSYTHLTLPTILLV